MIAMKVYHKRIREASVKKIPYQLVVGDKELKLKKCFCALAGGGDFGVHEVAGLIGAPATTDC